MTPEDILRNDIDKFLLELNAMAAKVQLQEKCEALGLYSEYSKFAGEALRLHAALRKTYNLRQDS